MRLTRRDALAALAVAGVAGSGAAALSSLDGGGDESDGNGDETDENRGEADAEGSPSGPIGDADLATLTAAAAVLYPSAVDGVEEFVTAFARGRSEARPDHAAGVASAVAYLDEWTRAWYDERFAALDPGDRETALDEMGAREADPDPDGSDVERVRYYVVNELLFALYASPTGGELVGIENPQGHPGGTGSYRRGPE